MSEPRRDLLREVARYLEQQRQLGVSYFLDCEAPAAQSPVAAAPPAGGAAIGGARPGDRETRGEGKPGPGRPLQAEGARFVETAMGLIARTRAAAAAPAVATPVQETMFGSSAAPAAFEPAAPAPPPADPAAALDAIAEEIRTCTRCALSAGRTLAVPGTGHPQAGLVLIGEAPGQEEDRQGLPFVGRSGQLLTDILRAIGFARQDVFICNILKCRPPNNRDPERDEATACASYLARQLAVIRPRLILCLGRIAAQRLLGTDASLSALRGAVHFHAQIPVLATFHPAALLRNPAQKHQAWDDVRKLRALYEALLAPDGEGR